MRARLRKLWPLVKLLLGVAIVVIIGRRFTIDLREHPGLWRHSLRPGWLVLCGALYLLGLGFWALCWHRLMRSLGERPPFLTAVRAYYIGHMGKYLPGKAWAVFLRAGLVRGHGASPVLATVTAFYEVLVTMSAGALSAVVFFLLLLPPSPDHIGSGPVRHKLGVVLDEAAKPGNVPVDWQRLRRDLTLNDEPGAPLDRAPPLALALGLFAALMLPILPPVFNRLVHHLSLPFRAQDAVLPKFGWRGLAEGLLATGLGWMCQGGSLWAALHCGPVAEPPAWAGDTWGLLTAVVGLAFVCGFVVLLAPSGLGVREFVFMLFLVALLGVTDGEGEASLLLAILALRLAWTAAEVVMIALVWKLPGPPVISPLSPEYRGEGGRRRRPMISAVIPVYNERESLPQLHAELSAVAAAAGLDLEVVFVDDGSGDGSWAIITELAAKHSWTHGIRFRRNFGKAAALSAGFKAARGDVVFTLDADLQDDPKEVPRFLEALAGGLDVVSGWKRVRLDPWHKTLPSKVFNGLVGWLTGVRLHDHNCGFKCYRAEVLREVRLYGELHRFVPVLAAARGFKVGEIAVDHRPRRFGHSKYGVRRFVKGFLDLMTVKFLTGFSQRPQHLLGTIGLASFALGVLGMGYLAATWVLGNLRLIDYTPLHQRPLLIYSVAALLLGAQMMSIGFLAELMTSYQGGDEHSYSVAERTP